MEQHKIDAFIDLVQGEGMTIQEVIDLCSLVMGDYRDDILESQDNQKKITLAMNYLAHAKKLVNEAAE